MTSQATREEFSALGVSPATAREILLVDDQPENLQVLAALLEDDWSVRCAGGAPEALEMIADSGPPDVVISDQRMPQMTGVEFLSRVARDHPDTVRMILTGYTDLQPMIDAVNHGSVSRFVFKPWDASAMRAAVREAFALKNARANLVALVAALGSRRSELRQTLAEQRRAQAQLAFSERLSTLGRLTAGITHDLRNHLGVMVLLVDEVRRCNSDPALQRIADEALGSLRAVSALVKDVNVFAQHQPLTMARVDVTSEEFVSSIVALLRFDPDFAGCRVEVDVSRRAPLISADPHRLRQALIALLRNAAHAAIDGVVHLRLYPSENDIVFEVEDRGAGMDPATAAACREPFFSRFDGEHVGLGLGIVDLVAAGHGGRLEIDSLAGRGTKVRLILPRSSL